jgi:hypothetical protein
MSPEEIADLRRRCMASGMEIEMTDDVIESEMERRAVDDATRRLNEIIAQHEAGARGRKSD